MMDIVDQINELNLDPSTMSGNSFLTPMPNKIDDQHQLSLSAQILRGLHHRRASSSMMSEECFPESTPIAGLRTPAQRENSWHRSLSNSFLVKNAPRLPASPDVRFDADIEPVGDSPDLPAGLFAPNLAPQGDLPMPIRHHSIEGAPPPPMPMMSPVLNEQRNVEPLRVRTGMKPYMLSP